VCQDSCDASTTCSDNGFCNEVGECTCFRGFQGPNCVSVCGDSIQVADEECEHESASKNTPGCSADCKILDGWFMVLVEEEMQLVSVCGDGAVAIGSEQCDDNNTISGDGGSLLSMHVPRHIQLFEQPGF
jgi:cysteine-rich repeat protein